MAAPAQPGRPAGEKKYGWRPAASATKLTPPKAASGRTADSAKRAKAPKSTEVMVGCRLVSFAVMVAILRLPLFMFTESMALGAEKFPLA